MPNSLGIKGEGVKTLRGTFVPSPFIWGLSKKLVAA
jgi:hypothetical protein